jgi:hypothetical protein
MGNHGKIINQKEKFHLIFIWAKYLKQACVIYRIKTEQYLAYG